MQTLAWHDDVAWANLQVWPQPVQFWSVPSGVSQPGVVSQSAKPDLQLNAHAPLLHVASALGGAAQLWPQPPQWRASDNVLTQSAPQRVGAVPSQVATQVSLPATSTQFGTSGPQAVVQSPQWAGVFSGLSQSGLLLSQLPKPASHTAAVHWVPSHIDVALANAQVSPQWLQLPGVPRGVSQPGASVQSPNPSWHAVMTQVPPTQATSALGNAHWRPQPPQLSAVARLVSHPSSLPAEQ
jgi:hypothetical protein